MYESNIMDMDNDEIVERGERIVKAIAIVGIIFAFINGILNHSILITVFGIAINAGLLAGKNWIRILYVILSTIGIFVALVAMAQLVGFGLPAWSFLLMFALLAVDIVIIILLLGNRSVVAYFEHNMCTCR